MYKACLRCLLKQSSFARFVGSHSRFMVGFFDLNGQWRFDLCFVSWTAGMDIMTTMPGSLGCVLQVKALLTGSCVDRGFERWVDYSVRIEGGFQLEIQTEDSMRCDTGCLGIVGTGSDDEKGSRLDMESSALQPLKERIVGGVA